MDTGSQNNKKPNPRENANPLSVVTFFYTLTTFFEGFKKDLQEEDLYETLSEHKSNILGDKLEASWNLELKRANKYTKKPSLLRCLIKTFGFELFLLGFALAINEICIKIACPLCLGQLILYFMTDPSKEPITKPEAYLYAGGIILICLVTTQIQHPYLFSVQHLGLKLRVASCSLVYRKALRLNKTALGRTTIGQVVNLLSNDVNRFDLSLKCIHHVWVGPIQTIVVMYLMYVEVGVSAIFGVVVLLSFIPLQVFLSKMSSVYRLKTALKTDERVCLMNEVISGIQVIKMYTWEKSFAKLVAISRRIEIKAIRGASYIRGVYTSFMMFTTRTSLFITILTYVLCGNDINARQVFMITALYNLLRGTMTIFFPQGLALMAETLISIDRLNTFLLYDEIDSAKPERPINGKISKENSKNAIAIERATAKWIESSSENTLTNINMNIISGSLVAVIGTVGSGKTSLLQLILKELPLNKGKLNINGKISYASQEPWLFTGSVRQNILFGQEMDKLRYKAIVKNCALERDYKLLPYADKTIVGERGVSLSGGQRARINLARAIYKKADIYLLDDPLSAVDTHVGKKLFNNCIREYLQEKTVILITHQLQYLKDVDYIFILKNGKLKTEGTFEDLQKSGLDFEKLLKTESENVNNEDNSNSSNRKISQSSITSVNDKVPKQVEEQRSTGSISGYVYKAYISAGGYILVTFSIFLLIAAQVVGSLSDYFITLWVNLEEERGDVNNGGFWDFSTETSIYIYTTLTILLIAFSLSRSVMLFEVCIKASVRLHDKMFNSIICGTMRFFNTNTTGRILNRFSKDVGAMDERLPLALVDAAQFGLTLVAVVIVVLTLNPWFIVPTVIIALIFYFLREFYLRTSRDIKRLEGVTRSPVFAHLNASLQGLATVRAFGAQEILKKEFDNHQDLNSSASFLFIATSIAFGYWLDLVCVIYVGIITMSFVIVENEEYGGNVGLAITQSLALTGMFQWTMRQLAELENQMTSVERVVEYTTIEKEPSLESPPDKKPLQSWPDRGEIKFLNLFLYYFPDHPPVLKNLNFTIYSLEKIGIVGRTGAGKSSLISALFRLTDIKGFVIIDGINTEDLGLHDLRSKISIIPQEPVLFSGTMRKNLDPFNEYADEVLWKALEDVELKEAVNDMPAGLNSKISEGGANFSVGQRQLMCLARAIIRNNKILVLDEATANIDPQTDALIQYTIKKKFSDCTVLTIAHRLHTIIDSDRVLVMDAGSIVEFDHPYVLLQNSNSFFYGLIQETGKSMAESLTKAAAESYSQKF